MGGSYAPPNVFPGPDHPGFYARVENTHAGTTDIHQNQGRERVIDPDNTIPTSNEIMDVDSHGSSRVEHFPVQTLPVSQSLRESSGKQSEPHSIGSPISSDEGVWDDMDLSPDSEQDLVTQTLNAMVTVDDCTTTSLATEKDTPNESLRDDTSCTGNKSHMDESHSTVPMAAFSMDLARSVKGMFRMLDLVGEQGSGGLVDKVIIAQDSLRDFINTICPGAYSSLTKVDFKALDNLAVRPIGVYGSKAEIVRLLSFIEAIDNATAHKLLSSKEGSGNPFLRSGLYLVKPIQSTGKELLYVVYWPEDTTWNDDAISSVRRNRITFMRYLTKIADQVISLVSSEHANAIVWSDDDEDISVDMDNEKSDRLFTFEVAKTKEQEENVTARPGFDMRSQLITEHEPSRGCSVEPDRFTPKLLSGETCQAFMTTKFIPASTRMELSRDTLNSTQLRSLLSIGSLHFSKDLDENAITYLVNHGLQSRFPQECKSWRERGEALTAEQHMMVQDSDAQMLQHLTNDLGRLELSLYHALVDEVLKKFPTLDRDLLGCPQSDVHESSQGPDGTDQTSVADYAFSLLSLPTADYFSRLVSLHPQLGIAFQETIRRAGLNSHLPAPFSKQKHRLISIQVFLERRQDMNEEDRYELIELVLHGKYVGESGKARASSHQNPLKVWAMMKDWFGSKDPIVDEALVIEAHHIAMRTSDVDFLDQLPDLVSRMPFFEEPAEVAWRAANSHFLSLIRKQHKTLVHRIASLQENFLRRQIRREAASCDEAQRSLSRRKLIQDVEEKSRLTESAQTLILKSIETTRNGWSSSFQEYFKITAHREVVVPPSLEYSTHVLGLTAEHRQNLQLSAKFVPSPHVEERLSHSFRLPVDNKILHAQLLRIDRFLLVIEDCCGNLTIFLEHLSAMASAIERNRYKKVLHRDKIGSSFVMAFDESKRMLAVCGSPKLQLHIFVFDETFTSLQAFGSAINLTPWYPDGNVSIRHACFVNGTEEVLMIDTAMQARIFSLITQQFRPACLQLNQLPRSVYSSPDGSCLFLSNECDSGLSLCAYHWSTFGSTDGILFHLPELSATEWTLTAFLNRNSVHFVGLDCKTQRCISVALDITRKVTEFMFKAKGVRSLLEDGEKETFHNCLIDCHSEVWTRFPVVPAVQRQTIVSSRERHGRSLLFVTDRDHDAFAPYFKDTIRAFEKGTKKPTGDVLRNIHVTSMVFNHFAEGIIPELENSASRFRAGEWLVDLLCLIPIQIAMTRDNRFVPLKDGVSSAALEKSLLGAEVGRIVDSLSFGWYESLFQSYMVSKPVKVVSSMGEQSVGKSFALNHLVDTSFAGSAMRTTEGVWMSVTPTDDSLIVALDFEGVHSIERSAQEDTLLVLFNTAISNLVLFRNNFALSRDITGLFQSFQSSSSVLDPAANPTLFQSTLVIIIKDVVDSDKAEIAKEFHLKLHKIVQDEQEANFLSRLHGGKLELIPWPVIESKQFYALFPILKRCLDRQTVTHPNAGGFLNVMKTLMAKLKANDWGAMSQTLAAHRAQRLLSLLPTALMFGVAEVDHEVEVLKNFDTNAIIEKPDTSAEFILQGMELRPITREPPLVALRKTWEREHCRQLIAETEWISALSQHLDSLADMRIDRVNQWISSNLERFKTGHASIEELRRTFNIAKVDLKANIQLCKMQCADCHLFCLHGRSHGGLHNCQTSHLCIHACDFPNDHPQEQKGCGHPAGHAGKHICDVAMHLCGEPCDLIGKQGCLRQCTKAAGHAEEDHMCSASLHTCGEPCDLIDVKLADGSMYSCTGTCGIASHEVHSRHVCDNRMCPVICQLCKRFCSSHDHLHGLEAGAVHLCGQEHPCRALCSAAGICEIDTAPQSIEATFTGRHETFQYTKYSQVAKRRKCIIPIGAGVTTHAGAHSHSTDPTPFHFCENQCDNCGYYCTLPRGHTQQEHETSHGSMSKTRWAVDGPDGTHLELEGRKFASNDDGAPMMCNLVCQSMGRHVHVDYCRVHDGPCGNSDVQHISARLTPEPDRAKDWITHSLYWRRTGFKDPYSQDERTSFAKCDAMCSGNEHTAAAGGQRQLSYCTLPIFHAPQASNSAPAGGLGYVSNDGHFFTCRNPIVLQQAFHIMFVIDRSGSMDSTDRGPLPNVPSTNRIRQSSNNRLGAVYSSLHAFWLSRNAAITANAARRDAYSVILFDQEILTCIVNDFTRSPDELLSAVLACTARGGTNFTAALNSTRTVMQQHWSTERTPVVIFLSDGGCTVADQTVQDLCRTSVRLGKPLSFHAVSFGPDAMSSSLRRMAEIALDIQTNAPRDPLAPAAAMVNSSYSEALNTVRLAETFLGIAESLRKPRGSLLC